MGANTQLIAEEYITGRELTVSVLDGRALCVTEIHVPGQFYDFDAKYKVGGSQHTVPADVPEEVTELSCGWAERAFTILGCRGVHGPTSSGMRTRTSSICWRLTPNLE
ncbi:MAG: hypothetical protein CM15mP100_1180 [Alphaproteobacteria bacterium]|nr:MAG: hypothetical protein CM15mP100_1180 [Alphaproteobacteria bacterium]